jgi:hypothetical protein
MTKETKWEAVGNKFSPLFRMTVVGQQVWGTFVASRESDSKKYKGKKNHFHEVEIVGGTHGVKPGRVALVGGGHLDYLFKTAAFQAGDKLRVTFLGRAPKSKKWRAGKEPYQFTLERSAP